MEITQQIPPLQKDAEGVVRVGGTRVPLETLVVAFEQGATVEEIAQQYPSVELPDIYAIISYYLRNRSAVEAYRRGREAQRQRVQDANETRFDLRGIRERLLARQSAASRG